MLPYRPISGRDDALAQHFALPLVSGPVRTGLRTVLVAVAAPRAACTPIGAVWATVTALNGRHATVMPVAGATATLAPVGGARVTIEETGHAG